MRTKHLLLLGAALILASCGINKKAYKNSSHMAIISINSIEKVKNNNSLQGRLLTEVREIDTNLSNPANMVHDKFYDLRLRNLSTKLMSEDKILNYPLFQQYAANNDNNLKGLDQFNTLGVKYIAVDGYPVIKSSQKTTIMAAFDSLPEEVDAIMVISNYFSFIEDVGFQVGGISTAGLHKQRVQSQLTVYMLTRDGKKILHKIFMGTSEDKLGSHEDDEPITLDEVAQQALDESMREFQNYLVKKVGG
jgi:hypothetical protein